MSNSLKKIINLIKETGNNCIILDHGGEPAYVIINFSDYQRLISGKSEVIGLTKSELVDKINRDIALWKASQQAKRLDNWEAIESAIQEVKEISDSYLADQKSLNEAENAEESDEKYYFEPIE